MAPTPDDDGGYYGGGRPPYYEGGDYPYEQGVTKFIPTMTTCTFTDTNAVPTTAAYFLGSWVDGAGGLHTYTISEFDDLGAASIFAASIAAMPSGGWDDGGVFDQLWSQYYSGYASATFTTFPQVQAAPTSRPAYTTPPQTGAVPTESAVSKGNPQQKQHRGPPITALAVGIIVPIIICIISIVGCICVSHYRRKARRIEAEGLAKRFSSESSGSEMQQVAAAGTAVPKPNHGRVTSDQRAYLAAPLPSPTSRPGGVSGTGLSPMPPIAGAVGSQQEQPVILSTQMNNGFFTGIDTSDAISMSDARSMASRDTFGEEPPPPYRPRSVPPISRETSVRTSIMSSTPDRNSSVRSHRNTLSAGSVTMRSNQVRSPFDDPEEEEEEEDDDDDDDDDDNNLVDDHATVRGSFAGSRETDRLSLSRSSTGDLYHDSSAHSNSQLR